MLKKLVIFTGFMMLFVAGNIYSEWSAYRGNDGRTGSDNTTLIDPNVYWG
jgi:hypothetical protein